MRLAPLLLLFFGLAARAEQDPAVERARVHVTAGISYYDEARYDDAVREMETAYALKPLADLQYNIAQCYERLAKLDAAVAAYRKYLDGKKDSPDRPIVEKRIENLTERAREAREAQKPPAPPPPTEKVVMKTIVIYRETPPAPGRGARFAAYGLGVLAVGALASGITFSVLGKKSADDVSTGGSLTAPVLFDGPARDAQASVRADQIAAGVSYGVAGVAAVGAVGLYLLGARIDREAPKLTLAPSLGTSGGGLVVGGAF